MNHHSAILCAALVVLNASACVSAPVASRAARELVLHTRASPGVFPIVSTFGDLHDARDRRRRSAHSGIDIRAPAGTAVVASAAGRVTVLDDRGAGTVILLETTDTRQPMVLEFAHLSRALVASGADVARGQTIAAVGRTGRNSGGLAHLHFAVAVGRGAVIDPVPLLTGASGVLCAGRPRDTRDAGPELLYPVACVAE